MKKIILILTLLIFTICQFQTGNLIAQESYSNQNICELINDDYKNLVYEDKTINYELNKILDIVGFYNQKFLIQACSNLENAITFKHDGNNYILYGERFLKSINDNSNLWAKTFLLAHEIGHHIHGHAIDISLIDNDKLKKISLDEMRKNELEADNFAGYILGKLGASLEETSNLISILTNYENDLHSTHPNKSKRLQAIKNGFFNSKKNIAKNQPNSAFDYFLIAKDKYIKNDYSGAIIDFNHAIDLDPNLLEAYYNRAILKKKLNDFEGAVNDYNIFISENKNDIDAYLDRALCKAEMNDFDGCVDDLNTAIEIDSEYSRSYFIMGVILNQIGQIDEAKKYYDISISIDPNYESALLERAKIYSLKKLYSLSINDYDLLIKINPNNNNIYSLRGKCKYEIDDFIGCIMDLERYLMEFNIDFESYNLIGICKFNLKDYSAAIDYYNSAINLNLNFKSAYRNRGIAKEKINDFNGACLDWKKAFELGCIDCKDWYYKLCK